MTIRPWGDWGVAAIVAMGIVAAVAAPAWGADADLARLIEGAKKEGEVHYLDAMVQPKTNAAMERAFRAKYGLPDSFKFTHTLQGTGQVVASAQQEIKAGRHTFDLVWVPAPSFFKVAAKDGHLLPYLPGEWNQYEREAKRARMEGEPPYWVTPAAYTFVPAWNRKCPGFADVQIKSWKDLQNPAFKGKLIVSDARKSFSYSATWAGMEGVLGREYFTKLVETTRPAIFFRTEEVMQKMLSCEYPIALWQLSGRVYQRVQEDPAVDLGVAWPQEGVVLLGLPIAIMKGTKRPNAAKLFMEFVLSEEGMREYVAGEALFSFREGLKVSEAVRRFTPELERLKILPMDWSAFTLAEVRRVQNEFRKVLGVD